MSRDATPYYEHDQNYMPIPDAPGISMLDVNALPIEVVNALRVCREYEAEGAHNPSLLANPVRAWFRYEDRR